MNKHVSQNDLQLLYKKEKKSSGGQAISEALTEVRPFNDKKKLEKTIFLCHSHLDKTIVSKIALLFRKLSVDIYIDWMDDTMPKVTDNQTASQIKDKILSCRRFLFLATYNGLRSKWCDWELGLAYSLKGANELAILPIESKSGNWRGSEYLQLYPEMIIKEKNLENVNLDEVSIKTNETDKEIGLLKWLN